MKIRCAFIATTLIAGLIPLTALATAPAAHLLVAQDRMDVRFNAAGGSTIERTEIVKALDAAGAGMLSRFRIPFNADRQHVTVHGASVVLPDEAMRLVPATAITTEGWPGAASSPSYADAKQTVVHFGRVPIGAVVSIHYTLQTSRPWLANRPSFFAMAPRTEALQAIDYTVSAPASLNLVVHTNAMAGGEVRRGSVITWSFHASKLPPLFNVASAAERMSKSPFIVVGGRSAETSARSYLERIHGAERTSLELQHLADVLGEGSIVPASLMARDYAWISRHVKLVDVPLALSGLPRSASDILLDQYGTVEDRAILLQALLKAKSVPSDVVLLPTQPISWSGMPLAIPALDDRVLLSVDGGRMPLDIGSSVSPIGSFGADERGKFGLRIAPHGGIEPLQVPLPADGSSFASVSTNVIVQSSGALDGAATLSNDGDLASVAREAVLSDTTAGLKHAIAPYAPRSAIVTVTHSDDAASPSTTFVLTGRYSIAGYHPLTGAYRMPVPRVITGFNPMDDFARAGDAGLCQRTARDEITTIRWVMPVVVDIPHSVSVNLPGGLGDYSATYVYDDAARSLHVERRLRLNANPLECDKQQQQALAGLALDVDRDLNSNLMVRPVVASSRTP